MKTDFIRTPDGSQRITDANMKATKAFYVPDYTGVALSLNGNISEDGAIAHQDGALWLYTGGAWIPVGANANLYQNGIDYNPITGKVEFGLPSGGLIRTTILEMGNNPLYIQATLDSSHPTIHTFRRGGYRFDTTEAGPSSSTWNMVQDAASFDWSTTVTKVGVGLMQVLLHHTAGMVITDSLFTAGLKYNADYSAHYTSLSIPHKGYVDAAITTGIGTVPVYTATKGITKVGNDFVLGGSMGIAGVTISGTRSTHNFSIQGATSSTTGSLVLSAIDSSGNGSQLQLFDNAPFNLLYTNTSGIGFSFTGDGTIRDDINTKGISGYADYSANYTSLSYVQKAYVDSVAGGGSGSVTSVSVVTANGVTGSVATSTTTPAITLSFTTQASTDNSTKVATTAFVKSLTQYFATGLFIGSVDPTTPAPGTSGNPFTLGTINNDVQLTVGPINGTSVITKSYADNLFTGLSWKQEVRVATTANITLSGTQTIDGVAVVAGDRVLVKNQTTQTQNGIYLVASGSWTRTTDADSSIEIGSATALIRNGTTLKNTQWTCTNSTDPVIGTDNITFGQISGAGTYTNGTGLNLSSNVFSLDTTYTKTLFSATSPIFYDSSTGIISSQAASGSQNGYLTSTDWSTFNGKLSANQTITLSGDVSGSGTTTITTAIGAGVVSNTMLAGSIANAKLSNSTISGVSLGGALLALTATDGTLTFSGSYTGAIARTVGLNLGNANTWTAAQTFTANILYGANATYNLGSSANNALNVFTNIVNSNTSLTLATTSANSIIISQNSSETARFNASGRLLIASTTDDGTSKLQVYGGTGHYVNGIAATTTDGVILANTTASLVGTVKQISPSLHFQAHVWNTTATAVDNYADWINYADVTSSGSPTTTLTWKASRTAISTPSYTTMMTLDNAGTLTVTSVIGSLYGQVQTNGSSAVASNFFTTPLSANNFASATTIGFGGTNNIGTKTVINGGQGVFVATTGYNYTGSIFASHPLTTASASTTAWANSVTINPLGTITLGSGGATLTNTATLYVNGASSSGINNYALYVASGNVNIQNLTASKLLFTDASKNLTSTGIGTSSQFIAGDGSLVSIGQRPHVIFTPTTGGTVALTNNQYNIINPAGALLALTVNLPSSPANNDCVFIKFTQNVTTVTYGNGTVVDGITAPTAGGLIVLVYDSGTTSWY